ncbi:MAG TPA: hypothetical protein VFU22_34210 [Roseiflexaceae bacterium]|nr:hypothetical protein [Roseiflexaceae bacterium]
MVQRYELGRLAGLRLTAGPSAIVGSAVLWVILGNIAWWLGASAGAAILGGLVAVLLHWASNIVHQLGHARAARSTGHPMIGIRLWWLLTASIYPRDEGQLPAAVHIRRALGGPIASLLLTLVAAVAALALRSAGGPIWWLAVFVFLDNLLVLTIGAFLPLGFTDGSTLLYWWGKR